MRKTPRAKSSRSGAAMVNRPQEFPGRLLRDDYIWLLNKLPIQLAEELETKRTPEIAKGSPLGVALETFGLYWWNHYELPFHQHVAVLLCVTGWKDLLLKAASHANPTKAFVELAKSDFEARVSDSNPIPDSRTLSLLLNFLIGQAHSLESISLYGLSINELLEKARAGDLNALKYAIGVDRTVVATPTAARVIAIAQLSSDRKVLNALFKRAKPHERRTTLADLRFYHRVFRESGALEAGVPASVVELIIKDLDGYPDRADSAKNIRQLFATYSKAQPSKT